MERWSAMDDGLPIRINRSSFIQCSARRISVGKTGQLQATIKSMGCGWLSVRVAWKDGASFIVYLYYKPYYFATQRVQVPASQWYIPIFLNTPNMFKDFLLSAATYWSVRHIVPFIADKRNPKNMSCHGYSRKQAYSNEASLAVAQCAPRGYHITCVVKNAGLLYAKQQLNRRNHKNR